MKPPQHDRVNAPHGLLNRAITMPDTLVYEYVTAVLDLATQPVDGNLRVLREGEIVATASIKIGGR